MIKKTITLLFTALMLFVFSVSAQTVPKGLSIDTDFDEGETGYYYVNMPTSSSQTVVAKTTITLPTGFLSSFKVYDNGGKNGNSSSNHISYITLTAPAGCVLRLSGNITTIKNISNDYLKVYDGTSIELQYLLGTFGSDQSGVKKEIEPIASTQQTMVLLFSSNASGTDLDLTVTVDGLENHDINVNQAAGGTVIVDKNSAKTSETVTLTATPSEGYLLTKIIVSDGSNTYPVSGVDWLTNTATFKMPNTDVTVTPVFTNNNWTADEGLFVSMIDSKDLVANIPIGMQSFKVMYGDGNSTASKTDATLKLTAPEGYVLQLSGNVSINVGTHSSDERAEFIVYDGESKSASKSVQYSANQQDITNQPIEVVSTGKAVYITCHTGWSSAYWNLDLTVTLNPIDEPHSVIVSNSISNGAIVADKASAKPNTTVNLTVTPDEGYVLKSINVTDANGNIQLTPSSPNASFGDVNYFTASNFSFTMRTTDATVSATFMPKTDFYVTIPKTGDRTFTIPDGTTSFKVYAEKYDFYDNGYLLLTAPQGFKMEVSGRAYIFRWSSMIDYLEIVDGATNESTSLGKFWESTNASDPNYTPKDDVGVPVNVTSSGNKLLFYFYSNYNGYTEKGLNLTVTLIDARKSVQDLTVTIPAQTYTGSAIEPEVTVMDGETTLTLGTDYEVSYSNNTNVGTATVTITGKGNYSGTVEKTFTITPKVTEFGALTLTEDQNGIIAEIGGDYNGSDVAYSLESDIENVSVTFNRTFTAGVTSTIVLPFDIEAGGYSGGDFYEFSDIDTKTWTATMSKVTSVTAHTPYLFVPSGESLTISQKVTLKAASSTTAATTAQNGWSFTGVYQKKVWGGDDGGNKDYCFAANSTSDGVNPGDFVKIGTNVQVRAFRCYLTNSTLAKAKTDLPEKITIRLIDETSSVVNPDDPDPLNLDDSGDITTPVSEITPNSGTKVWSYDRTIFIEAQSGTDYQIIDLSGRMLLRGTTNSTREEITLNRTVGIVIVKIGGKTFKVNY